MDDFQVTDNFSFYELTTTNNVKLQDQNRISGLTVLGNLTMLAILLEKLRLSVGPLMVHSGYRSMELNQETHGSSKTSQHQLGQAADLSSPGIQTLERVQDLFNEMLRKVTLDALPFGQLILESASRDYGVSAWVHLSLGPPFRPKEHSGQVLRAKDGVYTFLKELKNG